MLLGLLWFCRVVGEMLAADCVGDAVFAEGGSAAFFRCRLWDGRAEVLDGIADGGGDFLAAGVGEAYVEDAFLIVGGGGYGSVDCFENIGFDELPLTQDLYASAISVEDVAVLDELF